ncbi:MAG: DUF697 domain-containing protein [Verrucomicrobia bacterium]|nr:DUF697 domain-containing protein [Verrucomicrobiota bacterium]
MAQTASNADSIIRQHVLLAAGAGLIPVPIADMAAITGIQLKMLSDLAASYDVPFSRHRVESILSSLIGGLASREIAKIGLSGMLKIIPVFGSVLGAASMPMAAAALTYAVGSSFKEHFAAGGNLENVNLARVRTGFRQKLETGRVLAKQLIERKSAQAEAKAEPENEAESKTKIYCIIKPNVGKTGKVYLKSYIEGWRPEKYVGAIDELKLRYGVEDLETVKDQIIAEYRKPFLQYLREKEKERAAQPAAATEA